MGDLYTYLSQEHEATMLGVLLGMAAAKRGTMDAATSKMLFLHLPARHILHPPPPPPNMRHCRTRMHSGLNSAIHKRSWAPAYQARCLGV